MCNKRMAVTGYRIKKRKKKREKDGAGGSKGGIALYSEHEQ